MQEELNKQVSELKITNGSLKDLVDNAQVALTKEQILVKNFQDQVSSSKVTETFHSLYGVVFFCFI